jgi:hypothetical protein
MRQLTQVKSCLGNAIGPADNLGDNPDHMRQVHRYQDRKEFELRVGLRRIRLTPAGLEILDQSNSIGINDSIKAPAGCQMPPKLKPEPLFL